MATVLHGGTFLVPWEKISRSFHKEPSLWLLFLKACLHILGVCHDLIPQGTRRLLQSCLKGLKAGRKMLPFTTGEWCVFSSCYSLFKLFYQTFNIQQLLYSYSFTWESKAKWAKEIPSIAFRFNTVTQKTKVSRSHPLNLTLACNL